MTKNVDQGTFFKRYLLFNEFLANYFLDRQKIDEAPTPYRYGSESDQSEAESGSSDGEVLSRRRKVSAGSFDQAPPDPDTAKNTHVNSHHHHHHHHNQALAQKYAQHSVMYQWETVHAKLLYEQHLQEMEQQQQQQHQHQDHSSSDGRMACDEPPYSDINHSHHVAHPYNPPLDTSNISANSYDAHEHEDDDHEEDDDINTMPKTVFRWRPPQPTSSSLSSAGVSHPGEDPPVTDFGELLTPPTGTQQHLPPPAATTTLPLPKPPRSALKKSSFAPSGNNGTSSSLSTTSGLSKLSIKRSTSQELQLQQSMNNNNTSNNNHISTGKSPKSVHIRDLPASASYSPPPPPSPMPPQQGTAGSPTYASIVATNSNMSNPANASYFRYSNPEGSYTTQHSALFAGINASMGGGHGDDDEDDDESDIDNDHGKHTLRINHHHSSTHHTPGHSSHINPTVPSTAHINVHPAPVVAGDGVEEEDAAAPTSQFRNKRAGHYNEYKVLMAMRAKMMEEDDEDDDDETQKIPN